jgi:peptide deformylase
MHMPRILKITRLGNPVLRSVAKQLTAAEIKSPIIQTLIANMRYTLVKKEYGVGLAAPQVGKSVALSVIGIKPTPSRPELQPFDAVIINPKIVQTFGRPEPKWEGCISCGTGTDILFAKVPRYKKIELRWLDETGQQRQEVLNGFVANVAQHELDHLNGVMFLDKVKDPLSYMMADEYRKRVASKRRKQPS